MSIYQKFAKDVGIVAVSEIVIRLRPILFLPILTMFLATSDYGVYATLFVTVSLLVPFSKLGADSGIIRFLSSENDDKKVSREIFSISLLVLLSSLLIAAAVVLSADLLANTVFGEPNSSEVIKVGALWIPLQSLFGISLAFFRMKQRMSAYSSLNIANAFLPLVLGTLLLFFGGGLLELVWSFVIVQSILVTVSFLIIIKSAGVSRPKLSGLTHYFKFGIPIVASAFSETLLSVGDRYVIGLMMGAAYVGVYSVSYTLGTTVLMVLSPISVALLAPASKSYDNQRHHEVNKYINYSIRYFLMLSIPAAIALGILSGPIIVSLTNYDFLNGAAGVTIVVAISGVFYGLYSVNSVVLYLAKKPLWTLALLIVAGVGNVLLNILLIPQFGLLGSAVATLLCFFAMFLVSYSLAKRYAPISFDGVFITKCTLAALAMGSLVYCISPRGWINILWVSALGICVYFGLLFALRTFGRNEWKFFKSIIKAQGDETD